MDFSLTPDQQERRDAILDFGKAKLSRDLVEADRLESFWREGWDECGAFGIHGMPLPQEFGGGGLDPLSTVLALEALGYACRDNGLVFSINAHMWTCSLPIHLFGSEEQKARYLPGLCTGELIGGNAMSEPDSGSDAFSLRTRAVKVDGGYVLDGGKVFVSNGPVADLLLVFATVDPERGAAGVTAFIVETGGKGFDLGKPTDKMGLRTSPMSEVFFNEMYVPEENVLGGEGVGVAAFTHSMEWERGAILAGAVGAMQRHLEVCVAYARQRRQFDKPISKFQLVSSKLVEMKMRLESARSMLYRFGWAKTQKGFALEEAAMAKLCISEAYVQSCLDAIQIHGGYGYMTEFGLERELRDALGSKLYSGTSEIQHLIIAQFMGL